LTFD
jgi:hypothetical protein